MSAENGELPHLGAPLPRVFHDAASPKLVPAVPWERGADEDDIGARQISFSDLSN